MAVVIRDFIYEAGEESSAVDEIRSALVDAGWTESVSGSNIVHQSALPDRKGDYAYVAVVADDGASHIGVSVSSRLDSAGTNGLAATPSPVISRAAIAPSTLYGMRVIAWERWFLAFPYGTNVPQTSGSGGAKDSFLLGGGLYAPLVEMNGMFPILAIGSAAYGGADSSGDLFGNGISPITFNYMGVGFGGNLIGGQRATRVGASDVRWAMYRGPTGVVLAPPYICRQSEQPYGPVGVLYDTYTELGSDWHNSGAKEFIFNGWRYVAPNSFNSYSNDGLFLSSFGGPLYMRFESASG